MKTVVLFVPNPQAKGKQNRIYTRSMRKIGFINNYAGFPDGQPKAGEHWLVEIARENRNEKGGGCFIIDPLKKLSNDDLMPLVHGMYDMSIDDDAIILTPHDATKFWIISPKAKREILKTVPTAWALVVNNGGEMWPRRRPAESVVEDEAKKLLDSLSEEP